MYFALGAVHKRHPQSERCPGGLSSAGMWGGGYLDRTLIFRDFVRTSFMDGPLSNLNQYRFGNTGFQLKTYLRNNCNGRGRLPRLGELGQI